MVCPAAIDKLEEAVFYFPDPYFQLLSVHECPQVTSDLMYLGSSTSTLNIEVNIEHRTWKTCHFHPHYANNPDKLQNHDFF